MPILRYRVRIKIQDSACHGIVVTSIGRDKGRGGEGEGRGER